MSATLAFLQGPTGATDQELPSHEDYNTSVDCGLSVQCGYLMDNFGKRKSLARRLVCSLAVRPTRVSVLTVSFAEMASAPRIESDSNVSMDDPRCEIELTLAVGPFG